MGLNSPMQIYALVMTGLPLLYFFVMALYSGRLFSTFTIFWPALSAGHFCLFLLLGQLGAGDFFYRGAVFVTVCLWLSAAMTASFILHYAFGVPAERPDYLIVLGAQVRGKKITQSLLFRLDRALFAARQDSRVQIIVSGGRGRGEDVTEAHAMADYLIKNGVEKGRIILEERSTSTQENIMYSMALVKEQCFVAVVTNSFHCYRAGLIARQMGFSRVRTLPARSNKVFYLNYLVREIVAVWAMQLRRIVMYFSHVGH